MFSRDIYSPSLTFRFMMSLMCCIACATVVRAQTPSKDTAAGTPKEEDYFQIRTVPIPEHVVLEVGGLAFMPDDALAVSTRHGEVWIIHDPYMKDGKLPSFRLFAQGLHEALGLNCIDGDLYLTQRSELTRLRDLDRDGEADEYKTVASWPLSGNYHEYAYGPVLDRNGNMMVNLNLAWIGHGASLSKWHGWMLRVERDGKIIPYATGLRSPAGFGLNDSGDMFYAENQGDWVGSGSITHVEEGDFLGNPGGLVWAAEPGSPVKLRTADIPDKGEPKYDVALRVPGLKPPSVWFPHTILGISTSAVLNYDARGRMGPFEGQLFVGDQGQSKIMRVYLEKVKGVYQGIVFPFREGFSSGILRQVWGSDGSMFVGMTSRGWSSTGSALFGLQQLVWNGKLPFEMKSVQARVDGFEVTFTQPVDVSTVRDPMSWKIGRFTYMYHHEYGSPVINEGACPIRAVTISPDRLSVRLVVDSMKLGYIHEIRAEGVRSSDKKPLLHGYGYYTLNRLPDGDKLAITAENRMKAPAMTHDHMAMATETTGAGAAKTTVKRVTKQPTDWTKGPDKVIVIGTKPGLKFDVETISVKPGARVKLVFNNNDDMLHNFVLGRPGTANKIGEASLKLGLAGEKQNYIPVMSEVMYHTVLLHPKESDAIYFTAPDKPGQYPYICTYPGHYLVMRGVMKVQ